MPHSLTHASAKLVCLHRSFFLLGSPRVFLRNLLASLSHSPTKPHSLPHSLTYTTNPPLSYSMPRVCLPRVRASLACYVRSPRVCSPLLFASFAPCRLMLVDSITHSRLRFRASCASIVCSPREVASSLSYNDFLPCEIDSSAVCLVCLHRLFTLCRTYSITHSLTYSLICVLSSCSCLACSPREIVLRVLAYIVLRVALFCSHRLLTLLQCRTQPLTHSRAHRFLVS
jgi:hypothetical protein